ncbi:class I adenylate-forming enzyme family protein [Alkalilacustris brevis]|uniref:class I adenylate-forming enzyme family protein n=1 Tax=Alkalilacustris brevis TaxID=2026338 RepID=UPI000E0DE29E|nr:class I adenylate-forming enzyme family protein [Alkalilacustris brevis]
MLSIVDSGPPPPCPAPFNIAAYVLAAGERSPDRSALQVLRAGGAERYSYGALAQAVRGTGTGLLEMGLKPGDRVLMRLANSVDFPVLFLGAIAAGLVPVPSSAMLTAPEASRICNEIAPALIAAGPRVALPENPPCPVIGPETLRAMRDLPPCAWHMGAPERLGYIVYTSGTSGKPRAVCHAHRAVWARRMMWQGWYDLREDDRLLHAGAFNWTYTLGTGLLDPWAIGATALIPAADVTPSMLPLLLKRFDATIFAAAPGVYRQMLKDVTAPLTLPRLRHGLSAGEKLPEATRTAWTRATGTEVHEAFGMSECSTFLSGAPARPAPQGASGYAQPGRHIAVLDPQGQPVPRGTPGVLAVHRDDPGLFLGYLGAETETRARFAGDWFLTGDMAVMQDDGAVQYLGRDDDMMNAGGVRVSPLEIESVLNRHPAIAESAACEVEVKPDVTVIAAFYVPTTPGAEPDEQDLATFAAQSLARYKQPRLYRRVDTLPRGPNNKLARRKLRDGFAVETGQ